MSDILWVIAILAGYLCGKVTTPKERAKTDEHLESQNKALHDDIAYYKKLTKTLVEENKELRKQLNESSNSAS